jgi:hypothetical protein
MPVFRFDANSTATLGDATISVLFEPVGYTARTVSYTLTVAALTPVTPARPSSYPAIPGKATWENTMTTLGARRCYNRSNPAEIYSITGVDSQVWFYDGAWVFNQIADYTGDTTWNACATNVRTQYRNRLYSSNFGIYQLYTFTDGLKRGCVDCDMRNREAIKGLAMVLAVVRNAAGLSTGGMRETSRSLETFVTYYRVFNRTWAVSPPFSSAEGRAVDYLLSDFDELFRRKDPQLHELFYDGLAMQALIRYYEVNPDPRIPVAIKEALDWIWTNAWDATNKVMRYNPFPAYSRACTTGGCSGTSSAWDRTLIMMVAPAYAWYWSITGDSTYQTRGDDMFEHAPRMTTGVADPDTDTITIPAHGLAAGDRVMAYPPCGDSGDGIGQGCTATYPGGLLNVTSYYVVNPTTNTIQLSTALGGSPVNITSAGSGFLDGCIYSFWSPPGNSSIGFNGKVFAQNYRWGFDYVAWREGRPINHP